MLLANSCRHAREAVLHCQQALTNQCWHQEAVMNGKPRSSTNSAQPGSDSSTARLRDRRRLRPHRPSPRRRPGRRRRPRHPAREAPARDQQPLPRLRPARPHPRAARRPRPRRRPGGRPARRSTNCASSAASPSTSPACPPASPTSWSSRSTRSRRPWSGGRWRRGVDFRYETEVTGLSQDADGVTLEVTGPRRRPPTRTAPRMSSAPTACAARYGTRSGCPSPAAP